MAWRIRRFDPARDLAAVRRCFVELQDHEHAFMPQAPTGAELVDEYVPFMLARCARPGGRLLVAEAGGQVVGFAAVVRVKRPEPDDTDPFHLELAELSVLAAHRGRGVGAALIGAAEAHARACRAPSLRVRVAVDNPGARRLYRRSGFRPRLLVMVKRLPAGRPAGIRGTRRRGGAGPQGTRRRGR